MTAVSEDATADFRRKLAELEQRLHSALVERDEAIERQTASALVNFRLQNELRAAQERQNASTEILRAISQGSGSKESGDADRSLTRIAETTARLFGAPSVTIRLAEGDEWVKTIRVGASSQRSGAQPGSQSAAPGTNLPATVYQENRQIHIPDMDNLDPSMANWPLAATRAAGARTVSGTPLRREGRAIGALIVYRDRLAPFTPDELTLLQSFADQAVIAIENARLFNETRAALDRQDASAEVLRAIAAAPNDAVQSLQQVVETTARLFGASSVRIRLVKDGEWDSTFHVGRSSEAILAAVPDAKARIGGHNLPGTVVAENRQIHIPDLDHIPPEMADWPGLPPARAAGARTVSGTPLRREGKAIGVLVIHRDRLQPFSDAELALQQSFADQAVIAIENARLFNETRDALERQTATSEILASISGSIADPTPVFEAVLNNLLRLFGTRFAAIFLLRDGMLHAAGLKGEPGFEGLAKYYPMPCDDRLVVAQAILTGRALQIAPILDNPEATPGSQNLAREFGYNAIMVVPMIRDGKPIGALATAHRDPIAFTDKQIELVTSFADQAVIAIENARLFNETKEALERQTATADILKVIASSPSDVQPVFDSIATSAKRLLGAFSTAVFRLVDGTVHVAAFTPINPIADEALRNDFPRPVDAYEPITLTRPGEPFAIPDTEETLHLQIRDIARLNGFRSMLFVPLMLGGSPTGVIAVTRAEPGAFEPQHVQLLQAFADQAVIAIENVRLFNETKEALERQTATSDILRVIAGSPSDVVPVFEAIMARALHLCEAALGFLTTYDGERFAFAAGQGLPKALADYFDAGMEQPRPGDAHWRMKEGEDLIHFLDQKDDDPYRAGNPLRRAVVDLGGVRSALVVALRSSGSLRGAITIYRQEVRPFSASHMELLRHFADQAVIAIENARLFNETREALERQTATADILKVIASSPSKVDPVFEAIAARAKTLLGGFSSTVYRFIDGQACLEAFTPTTPEADAILTSTFPIPVARFAPFEIVQAGEVTQITDTETLTGEILDIARARGFRSMLFVPLVNKGTVIGLIAVTRLPTGTFADHHTQLLKTFADQAVIAIENARLFDEVQARTRDLEESLQQQTATADVLKVISRSVFDLQTVLDTLVESAYRLCGARLGLLYLKGEEAFECKAVAGLGSAEASRQFKGRPIRAGRGTAAERVILTREVQCVENLLDDPEVDPAVKDMIRNAGADSAIGGARSTLAVPMTRDNAVVGVLVVVRAETGPFPVRQVEILQTFADQAVIAIENARLFDEVQAKTADLSESLQQQTATADVLKVISRSAFDLQTVLDTLVKSAAHLCEADMAAITRRIGNVYYRAGSYGFPQAFADYVRDIPVTAERRTITGRTLLEGRIVHVEDVLADPDYHFEGQELSGNPRSFLGVPLLREGTPIGALTLTRYEVRPFTQKQIELIATFADQAVIAIENVRLFDEVQARTRELSKSLEDLRAAQDRLIQTEKLASLGQLTAGIAHEIKNPLNFVNNFAALSAELTDELKDALKPAVLDETLRAEVDELTGILKDNLGKVVQHGKRADSIVKNMLLHSREGSGEHRPADINALVDESLNLAYHGARAEKPQFNVTLKRDFDPDAGIIEVFPQEITRVFLNLVSNGFYAVAKRMAELGEAPFEPTVSATTKGSIDHVEIRIRDNGIGIPPEVKEKMFNPFFTTKPAGEGTGLGLSMSHDIIVKQHGGSIEVETEPGAFTEFRILLRRTSLSGGD